MHYHKHWWWCPNVNNFILSFKKIEKRSAIPKEQTQTFLFSSHHSHQETTSPWIPINKTKPCCYKQVLYTQVTIFNNGGNSLCCEGQGSLCHVGGHTGLPTYRVSTCKEHGVKTKWFHSSILKNREKKCTVQRTLSFILQKRFAVSFACLPSCAML